MISVPISVVSIAIQEVFRLQLCGGGRVERWCWGVLLMVGQGPTALAVGAGGGCLGFFFSHLLFLFSFSLSLGTGPI